MCGIVGIVHTDAAQPVNLDLVRRMTDVLTHRGPDAEGFFWYGGTSGMSTVEKSKDATGKRPTRRSRI